MKNALWFNLLILIVGAAMHPVHGQSATESSVYVTEQNSPVDVDAVLELYEDASGALTIEDMRNAEYATLFQAAGTSSASFGFTASAYWARLSIGNPTDTHQTVYLRQDYPLIDELDFWSQNTNGYWHRIQAGDRRKFSDRAVDHRNILFPVELAPREQRTVYLRFSSDGPINIGLSLHAEKSMVENVSNSELGVGIYFGGFLVLVIYNFFIFMAVRDRTFVFYLLYVVAYGTYFAVHNGLAFQYFWPNNPWLANQSLLLLLTLTLIFGLQFARSFLDSKNRTPRSDFFARILLYGIFATFASIFILPYRITILILASLSLLVTFAVLILGIQSLLTKYRPARYFMLAWSALLLGVFIYMLKTFGLLPHNAITHYGFQIGSLIEMTLLSVALSSRVNDIQRQVLIDPLTSVHNRRHFDELLQIEFDRSGRYESPLSLMVIDIDNFKIINDQLGHAKGDKVLRSVAKKLNKNTRKIDSVCRYGGEEFAVIMPNTNAEAAHLLAERVRTEIQKIQHSGVDVTVSIGVSSLPENYFENAQEFFDGADLALYRAKKSGRNQVAIYTPRNVA